jgi:hypothetical protein
MLILSALAVGWIAEQASPGAVFAASAGLLLAIRWVETYVKKGIIK